MRDTAAQAAWLLDQVAAERIVASALSDSSKVIAECDVKERIIEMWTNATRAYQKLEAEGYSVSKADMFASARARLDAYAAVIELHVEAYKNMPGSAYFNEFKRRRPKGEL